MATIETNVKEFIEEMTTLEEKQLPYALSMALNNCLPTIRNDLISHISSKLTIRNKWLTSAIGIKYDKSNKTNLSADIFATAPWLNKLNNGGVESGKTFAVATKDKYSGKEFDRVGQTYGGKIATNMRPKTLKSSEYYKNNKQRKLGNTKNKKINADTRGRAIEKVIIKGKEFLVRHSGKKLQFLYVLVNSKRYKKRIDAESVVEASLSRIFDAEFDKAIDIAVLSAK